MRLARAYSRKDVPKPPPDLSWLNKLPSKIVPKKVQAVAHMTEFNKRIKYDTKASFDLLNVSPNGYIYFGVALGVAKDFRGKGLARELVLRAHQQIKEKCQPEYTYLLASGNGSQAVFSKVGYESIEELEYEKFVDKNGNVIMWDHRDHKFCKLMVKKLD